MRIAIDLGEEHTYLAGWERDCNLGDACIKIKIPGVAAGQSRRPLHPWDPKNIGAHIARLQREYLLPSRRIVESVVLAVPQILPLKARRELREAVEDSLGLDDLKIIPQPLALAAGYNLRQASQSLQGDILLVQARESGLDLAWLNISATAGIILEKQFRADVGQARQELTGNGHLGAAGGRLDYVLAIGSHNWQAEHEELFRTLAGEAQIICPPDLNFTTVEGLHDAAFDKMPDPSSRLSLIYPYEFYLEKNEPGYGMAGLDRIPFDTVNLELDCGGRYDLARLDNNGIYNLAPGDTRVHLRCYEGPTGLKITQLEPASAADLILEIDSPRDDLPPHLILGLDMAAACLYLNLEPVKMAGTDAPESLLLRRSSNQSQLLQLIQDRGCNPAQAQEWERHLLASRQEDPSLPQMVQSTLFHLGALLQLWSLE